MEVPGNQLQETHHAAALGGVWAKHERFEGYRQAKETKCGGTGDRKS